MHKRIIFYAALIIAVTGFVSCKTSKQLPYFKDLNDDVPVSQVATTPYEPLKLQASDQIQVIISSPSPEASRFFNLIAAASTITPGTSSPLSSSTPATGFINLYNVSHTGSITMPVLGDIPVAGMTTDQVKKSISDRLKDYLKEAVVTVTLTNFKVTVIGEVNRPVVIPVSGETINVLEAVGASGDMTVFGIRKNVKVIRKLPNGKTEVAVLDFNKSSVMQSPYFQLKQNDIVYITPGKGKAFQSNGSNIWIPIVTTLISVAAIIATRN
jgi:polysaccharide biosynthesis/export protein